MASAFAVVVSTVSAEDIPETREVHLPTSEVGGLLQTVFIELRYSADIWTLNLGARQ